MCSLNLAHAATIICYELFNCKNNSVKNNDQILALNQEIEYLFDHLFTALEKKNFFPNEKQGKKMKLNICNIFKRINKLSKNEVQTLRGIITALTSV